MNTPPTERTPTPESAPATPATVTTDGAQNRDHADNVPATAAEPEPPAGQRTRSTRQFDFGNGRRLVDMRATCGGVEIIPEAPGVNFDGLPHMTEREAILAALDCPCVTDAARVALVREIVTTGADGGDAIR